MTNVSQRIHYTGLKGSARLLAVTLLVCSFQYLNAQSFFPLKDVRPGLHGIGRTVFYGNRIEDFEVEILGVLENLTPKQSIILAKLSGGPLAQTGVMQGMSGSPVYIDGKLLGAVALGFPFAKEAIAGIQPIDQMIADAKLPADRIHVPLNRDTLARATALFSENTRPDSGPASFRNLVEISTPLAFSGFTSRTLEAFAPAFRKLGMEPQQGVSGGSPKSPQLTGQVEPGSMVSVQLLSGDMVISADGTVTYVDGKQVYAFGHRFLDGGSTDLPFARAEVVALLPTLNSSFKLSAAREWVGTMLSDRSTSIAGEIGRRARTIPLHITVKSAETGTHDYHYQVVNDRLLTPFITQSVIFSTLDRTERTLGNGTLRLHGRVDFEGDIPPLQIRDVFVSDSGLVQQVSADAVVYVSFILGAGFRNLQVKGIEYELEPVERKRQVRISQIWTSSHSVKPGDTLTVTTLLEGEDGVEFTRDTSFQVPIGTPLGSLNFTVSDAIGLNAPEFAGLTQSSLHSPQQLVQVVNAYRGSGAAYVRVWRQEPSFSISGPLPNGDLSDPPPSVMLILADPSSSASANSLQTAIRGSQLAELKLPVDGYVVSGAKTVQVEVHE
jgi:SpoIVB peptidase S55